MFTLVVATVRGTLQGNHCVRSLDSAVLGLLSKIKLKPFLTTRQRRSCKRPILRAFHRWHYILHQTSQLRLRSALNIGGQRQPQGVL